MRTISYSECNSFEEVRKLLERAFGEIDDINLVIAPEKAKRLKQIVADNALIEKKVATAARVKAEAEAKAKQIAEAQLIVDNAEAFEKSQAEAESNRVAKLKAAKKIIADCKKGGK